MWLLLYMEGAIIVEWPVFMKPLVLNSGTALWAVPADRCKTLKLAQSWYSGSMCLLVFPPFPLPKKKKKLYKLYHSAEPFLSG